MPVRLADSSNDQVGPYNRLSASQYNTWEDCPRMWWYQNKQRLKFPQTPPLFLGRAVEETVCRVLMESPGIVIGNAPHDVLKNGADDLLPLYENEIENDFEKWSIERVSKHWPIIYEEMKNEWQNNIRKAGNWLDYSVDDYKNMCISALQMHLQEVINCKNCIGESELSAWRNGYRPSIPAPDGRTENIQRHPLASEGECTLLEAWEIARPWFVDPDAEQFSMNVIHPDHWFQGEYDLVYRNGGRVKIVDLKASRGGGDRSGNYVEQLRIYAMLWSITHNGEIPNSLEIWYLGVGVQKEVTIPSGTQLLELENKLKDLWKEIKEIDVGMEDCPPIPRPLRGYDEGGVKVENPEDSRCDTCDWYNLCPNGNGDDDLPDGGQHQPPGGIKVYDLTPLGEINPRMSIFAEAFSVTNVPDKPPNLLVETKEGYGFVKIAASEVDGNKTYPLDLNKGDKLRLVDVVPSTNWKGEIQFKVDPYARIVKADSPEEGDIGMLDFKSRWNIAGRVAYSTHKSGIGKNGKPWSRKGLVLLDKSGRISVEGWDNAWPSIYNTLEQGDEVAILNVSLDAWAIDIKANLEKNSSMYVISRLNE